MSFIYFPYFHIFSPCWKHSMAWPVNTAPLWRWFLKDRSNHSIVSRPIVIKPFRLRRTLFVTKPLRQQWLHKTPEALIIKRLYLWGGNDMVTLNVNFLLKHNARKRKHTCQCVVRFISYIKLLICLQSNSHKISFEEDNEACGKLWIERWHQQSTTFKTFKVFHV